MYCKEDLYQKCQARQKL